MILILAGTSDARRLCGLVSDCPVIASLSGATDRPKSLGVETRIGGFGGAEGFISYINNNGIKAVVDATHPFASLITERSYRLSKELGIDYLRLERPAWPMRHEWHSVANEAEAISLVPAGVRVFLATGRQTLGAFEGLKKAEVFSRVVDKTSDPFPFERGRFIFGKPAGSVEEEIALFQMLGIDWLITKNSGGPSDAKLAAAEALGIEVIMLGRPELHVAPVVSTPEEAAEWVRARCV